MLRLKKYSRLARTSIASTHAVLMKKLVSTHLGQMDILYCWGVFKILRLSIFGKEEFKSKY